MNSIGKLGDEVMGKPQIFNALLANMNEKLNHQRFRKLCHISYSESVSNDREKEETTVYSFELFLKDLDDSELPDLTLEDLLVFITGADAVPPLGFESPLTIEFYDMEKNVRRLPHASTCSMSLSIPRGIEGPMEFKELMCAALLGCFGFGRC
jgi:hypothetical protein